MIAHVFHDAKGNVGTIVFQIAGEAGDLEISSDASGRPVTVDILTLFPDAAVDGAGLAGSSTHHLHLMARELKTSFEVDVRLKKLVRRKSSR